MYFQHIYDKSLAQGSYFVGCQKCGVAIVIDPKRDVDTYVEIAKQNNMAITHIAETHIHADFLSGVAGSKADKKSTDNHKDQTPGREKMLERIFKPII